MNRRRFLSSTIATLAGIGALGEPLAGRAQQAKVGKVEKIEKITKTPDEWRKILTPAQFAVLREEGTERAFTSPLNNEKRQGVFACAGCDLPLFTSEMKFESGTGWPSFFTTIPGVFETKKDYYLIYPREHLSNAEFVAFRNWLLSIGEAPAA